MKKYLSIVALLFVLAACGNNGQMDRSNYPANYHDGNADLDLMSMTADSVQHVAAFLWKEDKNKYSEMNYRFIDVGDHLKYVVRYVKTFTNDTSSIDYTNGLKKDSYGQLYLFTDVEYNKQHQNDE